MTLLSNSEIEFQTIIRAWKVDGLWHHEFAIYIDINWQSISIYGDFVTLLFVYYPCVDTCCKSNESQDVYYYSTIIMCIIFMGIFIMVKNL